MKATLLTQFGAARYLTGMNLKGITAEQSLYRPEPGGNCIRWLVGHLAHTYDAMLQALGGEPFLEATEYERFRRGSDPLAADEDLPAWDRMLSDWDEVQKRFIAAVEDMDPARAGDKAPYSPGGNPDETMGSLLALIGFHQAYHAGQIGIVRRLTGEAGTLK